MDLEGAVQRSWRIQRIQEVLVAKGGRYILVSACSVWPHVVVVGVQTVSGRHWRPRRFILCDGANS